MKMSSTVFYTLLTIHFFVSYGIKIDMKRELFYQGRELFCAQLQCTENIREDTQISALVNMSVYVINEPGDKLMLASVSGSDSKARDYKVPGVFVDGNISHHGGELQLFLSNDSACHDKTLKCEIYFTYKKGQIGFAEEETAPLQKENMRKSDLMMSLKAKTVNYVKTVDTMAAFLKAFEDPDKLKGADMSMSLQMSHLSRDDSGFPRKNFTDTHKQIESSNSLQIFETRLNNLTAQLQFVNERFNNLKDKRLNMTEQNTEKEQNTNSLIWTKEMCKRTHNFKLTSRQLVQLNQSKLTFCDTKTDDGGWILIQRRVVGDVNFIRGWDDYKHGFGSTAGDFWLGNDWISWLTGMGYTELRVDLDIGNTRQYAEYINFTVDNEAAKYKMNLSSFRGNATDRLSHHNGMKFTTIDSDNDENSGNCAQLYKGAWWYKSCHSSNLNGLWNVSGNTGIFWNGDVKFVEIKLRKI
ncbi:angiopoietin-related protein 7-like [Physella acuta]|uniref:angiopoietin-related protein 7-like n=1 Tax=Physella acuta TaxID=109671 RepID=UPI0027DD927D|nr:angiopoietin-related protein 7-like [Physella acuta]